MVDDKWIGLTLAILSTLAIGAYRLRSQLEVESN